MKTRLPLILAAVLAGLLGLATARAAGTELIPVAVLDLDATDARLKERGAQLSLLLATELSTIDGVTTVERQELTTLLEEQQLGKSGMVDPGTAARIGHLTGARVLVTGRIFTVGKETTAAVKLMSTETGRVFGAAETFSSEASPADAAKKLGAKLAAVLQAKRDDLLAKVVTAVDRVAAIRAKAAGRKLPSLTVVIPEQHVGAHVTDPAAQTEISRLLAEAGFTVQTGEAAQPADFRVEGEAFSATGSRRGPLVSCKARVELQVVGRDGKVVLADRQTTWAVDPAEAIAAKDALQAAGAELASRVADALLAQKN
jgi:hypothetical protein